MKIRYFFIFSVMVAILSMAGISLPANAKASTVAITTPTPKPALKTVIFDLKTANKVPPGDIINQVALSGRGGPPLCKQTSYPTPTIVDKSNESAELMAYSYMSVCGWTKNENLTGSVKFPNGQIQKVSVVTNNSNGSYAGTIRFRPRITDPVGKYTLIISGKSKSLQIVVNLTIPRGPYLYTLDNTHLLLYGFLPSEIIRLFYYSAYTDGALKGWQKYTAGTDGRLEIKTLMDGNTSGVFVAIGDKTGEVLINELSGVNITIIRDGKVACSNGIPSRVKVGDVIRAAYTDGGRLKIRDEIGFEKADKHRVAEGTKMTIVGGPECANDGVTWWKVKVSADVKGWVAEYWHGDEYLIEPAP